MYFAKEDTVKSYSENSNFDNNCIIFIDDENSSSSKKHDGLCVCLKEKKTRMRVYQKRFSRADNTYFSLANYKD